MLKYGMNRGIYIGARGMMVTHQWLDIVSNNLANASTDGYKADQIAFTDVLQRDLYAFGGSGARLGTLGGGPLTIRESQNMAVGNLRGTGNPLDVAIRTPRGMFAVETPGGIRYTRDGAFKTNQNSELISNEGQRVLDVNGNPIRLTGKGPAKFEENGDLVQDGRVIAQLGVFDGDFRKQGGTLWAPTGGVVRVPLPDLAIAHLESSNVEPIETMVELIKINRAYEMSQKSITTQDQLTGRLIDSLNH